MKVENVKTADDIERYIEECINDFEVDICNKDETIIAIAELVVHIYKLALSEQLPCPHCGQLEPCAGNSPETCYHPKVC